MWSLLCIFASRKGARHECFGGPGQADCGLFPCLFSHPGETLKKLLSVFTVMETEQTKLQSTFIIHYLTVL